jgi:hypothetical protein
VLSEVSEMSDGKVTSRAFVLAMPHPDGTMYLGAAHGVVAMRDVAP